MAVALRTRLPGEAGPEPGDEDSRAEVDMNIVKTGRGHFVEVQGTAEDSPFSQEELNQLMAAADKGIQDLIAIQRKVLGEIAFTKPRPAGSPGNS